MGHVTGDNHQIESQRIMQHGIASAVGVAVFLACLFGFSLTFECVCLFPLFSRAQDDAHAAAGSEWGGDLELR